MTALFYPLGCWIDHHKARGVVLGNPKLADVRDRAVASVKADADRFAKNVAPIIREIQSSGVDQTAALRGHSMLAVSLLRVADARPAVAYRAHRTQHRCSFRCTRFYLHSEAKPEMICVPSVHPL
jgi:hypothetical protein